MPALLDFPQYVERVEPDRQGYLLHGIKAFNEPGDELREKVESINEDLKYLLLSWEEFSSEQNLEYLVDVKKRFDHVMKLYGGAGL
ncbi:hypothetical protein NW801_23190 [Brevibacillus laterosporus]|uniref:Uncharacterized protein n=1 Tax=Brevibacillus halotolerans TaxID=1507437 RepID=A0ABT4I4Z3_9BACL|nr:MULTISPECIES: hypothetical protein [Brevibacillus]MCR8987900.1 hypothetical protein [Brevibacillus laterosporus]MCZ0833639.1 hypothetical protein [Brevibacillus halotolerans]